MSSIFKSIFKFAGKAIVYGIIAIGVWEALLGCPSARMMNKLLRDKDAWDPMQAENDGVCQHVQIWFMSWWHCSVRSPAKYITKRVKVAAAKAKRSYIRGWMARNRNNDTDTSITRGEERYDSDFEDIRVQEAY
ncbi:hypothetical protein F4813DRAFT_390354 [Daldinia decipiens]|uniref:uncharacterized protein n=1 Tax=Daldinia decipiens TaxID=326647 RepID=UPI0020C31C94|nr:uncharacterized protein F4813DRAFT_390354 [Daldinia decipiens]KAI1656647.1 hypothetical protein F4813DRAFT_390354 [Daldinia decipiens]